jgi:hypothetical protein
MSVVEYAGFEHNTEEGVLHRLNVAEGRLCPEPGKKSIPACPFSRLLQPGCPVNFELRTIELPYCRSLYFSSASANNERDYSSPWSYYVRSNILFVSLLPPDVRT